MGTFLRIAGLEKRPSLLVRIFQGRRENTKK